ncbi:MAG: hypothetical protein GU356_01510 [Pyrobaculum sp.]|nr:hypothetical protein [Pyrobaculum sp.]
MLSRYRAVTLATWCEYRYWRRNSKTPPHLPAERGRVGVASELINHGADVNARDNSGLLIFFMPQNRLCIYST